MMIGITSKRPVKILIGWDVPAQILHFQVVAADSKWNTVPQTVIDEFSIAGWPKSRAVPIEMNGYLVEFGDANVHRKMLVYQTTVEFRVPRDALTSGRKKGKSQAYHLRVTCYMPGGGREHREYYTTVDSGTRRFNLPPRPVDFETVRRFGIGQPLDASFLTRAYDPLLPGARDEHGHNCLTNHQWLSIPLIRPRSFKAEVYRLIRGMETIPEVAWDWYIRLLEGKYVLGIRAEKPAQRDATGGGEPEDGEAAGDAAETLLLGECYDGPYDGLDLVGRYVVFHVGQGEERIFLVDSPLYGIACHVFTTIQDALAYAEGGDGRTLARERRVAWIRHTGDWRGRVEAAIAEARMRRNPAEPPAGH